MSSNDVKTKLFSWLEATTFKVQIEVRKVKKSVVKNLSHENRKQQASLSVDQKWDETIVSFINYEHLIESTSLRDEASGRGNKREWAFLTCVLHERENSATTTPLASIYGRLWIHGERASRRAFLSISLSLPLSCFSIKFRSQLSPCQITTHQRHDNILIASLYDIKQNYKYLGSTNSFSSSLSLQLDSNKKITQLKARIHEILCFKFHRK